MIARVSGDTVASDMTALASIVSKVRDEYPRMELGQLVILLHALARPGVKMTELGQLTHLSKQAVSRNVLALSERSYLTDEEGAPRAGLDLLTQFPDPFDTRAKVVGPTRRGRQLAETLSSMLQSNRRKDGQT